MVVPIYGLFIRAKEKAQAPLEPIYLQGPHRAFAEPNGLYKPSAIILQMSVLRLWLLSSKLM
jgi:hypothetical protein